MKLHRPIIAMLSAVVLFLFYLWDVDHVERARLGSLQNQQVLFEDPHSVIGLVFTNEKGTFAVERTDKVLSGWMMTQPVEKPADGAIVDAYLENLRGAKRQAEFDLTDGGDYGFGKANRSVLIRIKQADGTIAERHITFGKQPVAFGPVYTKMDDDRKGFTVSEWFYRQSAKDSDSLRDKTIVRVDAGKSLKFRIETRNGGFELERAEPTTNEWFLLREGKKSIPADRSMVDRQLVTLLTARFVSIDDNPTTSSAELGLDHPTLKLLAGDTELVRLGEPIVGKEQLFARSSDGTVGVVTGSQFFNFMRPPVEWGTKRFVWTKKDNVQQVETMSGNAGLNLLWDGKQWIFADMPGVAVHKERAERFFSDLLAFSATQLVREDLPKEEWDKYGIVDEGYRVIVTEKGGLTQGFRFGITDSKEGITYVLREQDQSLWKIDVRTQGVIYKFRADLEDRRLFTDLVERTARLDIMVGKDTVSFIKNGDTWKAALPGQKPSVVPTGHVLGFLSAFEDLEEQSELLGGRRPEPQATFLFYEDGAPKPFTTVELMSKSTKADAPLLGVGSRLIEVDMQQLRLMDSEMVKLLMAAGGQQERQSPAQQQMKQR